MRTAWPLPRVHSCRSTTAPAASARAARLVGRAIVHDNSATDMRQNAGHHFSNRSSFVQRRNQRDDVRHHACLSVSSVSSAGSTSTDAAISATTLTTETTPIDRSGG